MLDVCGICICGGLQSTPKIDFAGMRTLQSIYSLEMLTRNSILQLKWVNPLHHHRAEYKFLYSQIPRFCCSWILFEAFGTLCQHQTILRLLKRNEWPPSSKTLANCIKILYSKNRFWFLLFDFEFCIITPSIWPLPCGLWIIRSHIFFSTKIARICPTVACIKKNRDNNNFVFNTLSPGVDDECVWSKSVWYFFPLNSFSSVYLRNIIRYLIECKRI